MCVSVCLLWDLQRICFPIADLSYVVIVVVVVEAFHSWVLASCILLPVAVAAAAVAAAGF